MKKRVTAMLLAGIMVLGTACGNTGGAGNTEKAGGQSAAGVTTAVEEAAAESAPAGGTGEKDAAADSQSDPSGKGTAKGASAGVAVSGDDAAYTGDGTVTAFIGEPFYDGVIKEEADALGAVESVYDRIGADESTKLELMEIRPTEDHIYYTFSQISGNVRVLGASVKLITDTDGKAVGLVSSILPKVTALPHEQWSITAEEAEAIIEDYYRDYDLKAVDGATERTLLPVSDGAEIMYYVWVVYTENIDPRYDTAYLAHYVTEDGEYLYALPISEPGNADAIAGDLAAFVFENMEEGEWTGTITHADGTQETITVPVMTDPEDGTVYLGDRERKILCADAAQYLYNNTLSARVSEDASFNNNEMLTYYNFVRIWDFYNEIGWQGPDDDKTPTLILLDLVDENGEPVANAFYSGRQRGFQVFAINCNLYGDCTDVLAHEFTHCVTGTTMTMNLYMNEYGAINEAMSDIQGNLIELMIDDDADGAWVIGENSGNTLRSMGTPNEHEQPGYVWDRYYVPSVSRSTDMNDNGGVHTNSSVINIVSYKLDEAGMAPEDQFYFWMNVALAMTPRTDFAQMSRLLPWCMETAGYPQYVDAVNSAIQGAELTHSGLPEEVPQGCGIIQFVYNAPESFDDYDPSVSFYNLDTEEEIMTWPEMGTDQVAAVLPEGRYLVIVGLRNRLLDKEEREAKAIKLIFSENGWEIAEDLDKDDWSPYTYVIEEADVMKLESNSMAEALESLK